MLTSLFQPFENLGVELAIVINRYVRYVLECDTVN